MAKQSVSFMVPSEKVGRLDAVAATKERDRSFILNEAIDMYLDLNDHHTRLIEQGIADIEAGRFSSHAEVGKALTEQRRRRSAKVAS
jgi:predicted transcriptional regulator